MVQKKNIAVINAIQINSYMCEPVFNGKNSLEKTLDFALSLPDIDKIVVLTGDQKPGQGDLDFSKNIALYKDVAEIISKSPGEWDSLALIRAFLGLNENNSGVLFYFFADSPLLDNNLAQTLYDKHCRYAAEFTFADGYPMGLAPEILSPSALSRIEKIALRDRHPIRKNTIFSLIQKEINDFDLETEISPKDLRLLRIDLSTENFACFTQTKNLFDSGITNAETALMLPEKGGEFLRSVPAYYQIQISGTCPQSCSYCPYTGSVRDNLIAGGEEYMPTEKLNLLLDKIESFSKEATVSLSLWGEPSLHPEIYSIIENCLNRESLKFVIETSGIGWDVERLIPLLKKSSDKIIFIISLDTIDPSLYKSLRGEGFEEVIKLVEKLTEEKLISLESDCSVYIQAVRMEENEVLLENFYKFFLERTKNIIIQKYDFFSGKLPSRKVTDLSPLTRQPCWHLKREMCVLLNGDVLLCREDLERKTLGGNLFKDSPEEIWEKGCGNYTAQLKGEYSGICGDCDEFYTFNF